MSLLIDIFLAVSIALAAWLGWSAGATRSFFAAFSGFAAVFAASRYPYQEGINFWLIFVISALIIIMICGFVLRLVNFFFMKPFDKAGGAVLSVLVWIVVSVNVIVPTLTHGTRALDGSGNTLYKTFSRTIRKNVPILKDYIPPYLEKKVLQRQSESGA
ncbi:MAG: hypothetical protein LBO62_00940 [Endomicrobium sp.]|jgi:uncharacterized membrane protein required for colicin V production|nr:hypothetical protein [Endomicrobium sp.]